MKVARNNCCGGFSLSDEACKKLSRIKGKEIRPYDFSFYGERTDPDLIRVIEELGKEANGRYADLIVVEVPDDVIGWYFEEYDGVETICEPHRTW